MKKNNTIFGNKKHLLILSNQTLKVFNRHVQANGHNESGGILLGSIYEDCVEILDAKTPNQYDTAGPMFFIRSRIGAQPKVNVAWKKSKGTLIYLGEWHTHSEVNPVPSKADKEMIKKAFIQTSMEIQFLFLIIVGQKQTFWVGRQDKHGLNELRPIFI